MLRSYELAYIADPDLDEEALGALEERVNGWVEATEGKVVNTDRWGKRKLAYPIQKRSEGFYFFLETEMPPQAGKALERDLGLNEHILRYMITSRDS